MDGGSLANTMLSFCWVAQESLGTEMMREVDGIRILCTVGIKGERGEVRNLAFRDEFWEKNKDG